VKDNRKNLSVGLASIHMNVDNIFMLSFTKSETRTCKRNLHLAARVRTSHPGVAGKTSTRVRTHMVFSDQILELAPSPQLAPPRGDLAPGGNLHLAERPNLHLAGRAAPAAPGRSTRDAGPTLSLYARGEPGRAAGSTHYCIIVKGGDHYRQKTGPGKTATRVRT
jgi:hypothetical protein